MIKRDSSKKGDDASEKGENARDDFDESEDFESEMGDSIGDLSAGKTAIRKKLGAGP